MIKLISICSCLVAVCIRIESDDDELSGSTKTQLAAESNGTEAGKVNRHIIGKAPGNMCGRPNSAILKILKPPAEVQSFLSFAFGVSWTIGKIDSYKEIDARFRPGHGTCENLPLNASREFVLLHMTTPDLSMLLTGGAADAKNADAAKQGKLQRQNAKSFQKSRKKQFTDSMPALPLPLCIAIRPCGAGSDTFLTQWDFGFYTDEGITIFSYPNPVDGPLQLKLKGLAFSTAGHLIPPKLDNPPLFGFTGSDTAMEPTNAHWWIYGQFVIPIQWGQKKIADFELDGKFSVYVDVNGNSDLADIILGLAEGGSPASITKFLVSSTYRFQLCGSLQANININLAEIFGWASNFMADMKIGLGGASILIDAKGSLTGESHLSYYFTGTRKIDLLPLLSNTKFLEKIMPNFDFSVTAGLFITVRSTGKIDFGFHFRMSMRLDCGIFDKVLSVFPLLGDICGKTHDFGVSLVVRKNRLSRNETCLRLGTKDYCLNVLPSCPPGQQEGERCSANSDCKKEGEENSYHPMTKGYCKSQNSLRTSVLCSGKCVKLAKAGQSCSADTTNTWNVATSAENEFCETGTCLCSTCAESNGKLVDGKNCATDANCNSGFCNKGGLAGTMTSQGCKGRCTAKKPIGGSCYYDAECLNNRCSEGCRSLFNCVSGGSCVQCRDDDRHCGGNQYCHDYKCYNKLADGQNVGRRRQSPNRCLTNKIICGNCGRKQPDGRECSASSDCDSNECNTKQWGTSILGCNGNCGARRRRRTRRRRHSRRRWR